MTERWVSAVGHDDQRAKVRLEIAFLPVSVQPRNRRSRAASFPNDARYNFHPLTLPTARAPMQTSIQKRKQRIATKSLVCSATLTILSATDRRTCMFQN